MSVRAVTGPGISTAGQYEHDPQLLSKETKGKQNQNIQILAVQFPAYSPECTLIHADQLMEAEEEFKNLYCAVFMTR